MSQYVPMDLYLCGRGHQDSFVPSGLGMQSSFIPDPLEHFQIKWGRAYVVGVIFPRPFQKVCRGANLHCPCPHIFRQACMQLEWLPTKQKMHIETELWLDF